MRQKIRRVTQVITFLALGSVISVGFQNCGTYEPAFNPLFDNASVALCIGIECAQDPEMLQIAIANQTVALTSAATASSEVCTDNTNCFDVAGFCDDGGYPDNAIYVAMENGPTGFAEKRSAAKCGEDGRFNLRVVLPAGYNHSYGHNLRLVIRGVDASNYVVDNPRNSNVAIVPVFSSAL